MARRWLGLSLVLVLAAVAVAYVLWPEPPIHPTGYLYHVQGGFAALDLVLEIDSEGRWQYRDNAMPERRASGVLTAGQRERLLKLTQEVDWPRLPPRFQSQSPPTDELLRTVEIKTPGHAYRVTAGSVAPIPSPLTNLCTFLEGVRRGAETTLPPRFHPLVEASTLYLVGPPGLKQKLLELGQLPATFRPQGANDEFGVGKDGFGPVVLSPDGTTVGWSTAGLHPLVGFLYLRDMKPVPLDLYFEGGVQALAWAPDGSYLAVQVQSPAGGSTLHAYRLSSREAVRFPARPEFPPDKYSLAIRGWIDSHRLAFAARPLPGAKPLEPSDWEWDLQKGKVSPRG